MLIYSPKISERLTYVLNHIFNTILGVDYKITTEEIEFIQSLEKVKLSFGKEFNKSEIFIPKQSEILFESNISKTHFKSFVSDLEPNSLDIFTTSFLFLSRYQEYLPFTADIHDRFPYNEDDLLEWFDVEKPWVDIFAYQLKEEILKINPDYFFPE